MVIVADLTQRAVLLEEGSDALIAHPQSDALPATPAVDLEIDHRTVFPFVRGWSRGGRVDLPLTSGYATVVPPSFIPAPAGPIAGRLRDQWIAAPSARHRRQPAA